MAVVLGEGTCPACLTKETVPAAAPDTNPVATSPTAIFCATESAAALAKRPPPDAAAVCATPAPTTAVVLAAAAPAVEVPAAETPAAVTPAAVVPTAALAAVTFSKTAMAAGPVAKALPSVAATVRRTQINTGIGATPKSVLSFLVSFSMAALISFLA